MNSDDLLFASVMVICIVCNYLFFSSLAKAEDYSGYKYEYYKPDLTPKTIPTCITNCINGICTTSCV